jgi:hypothetical protein
MTLPMGHAWGTREEREEILAMQGERQRRKDARGMDVRTTVYTDANDPDETDEFPGCFGSVDDDGSLTIVQFEGSGVETTYKPQEWDSYQTSKY